MKDRPLSESELRALSESERNFILAWREDELTGKKYSDSLLDNKPGNNKAIGQSQTVDSLDRPFAQLRQSEGKPFNNESDIRKFLKSHGLLYGDSLEGTRLYFSDEWDNLINDYEKWRSNMENCYLILGSKEGGEGSRQDQDNFIRDQTKKKGIIAKCQTRFSPGKRKITRWRMDQFSDNMKRGGFRFGLEVTLTTDPKRFLNLQDVGDKWRFFIEKFMDFARTRLRRAGKTAYCYLRACELTDSGLLHMHIGFFGAGITGKITKKYADGSEKTDYIFPQKDISELWDKYGLGEVAWVMKKPVDDAVDYVTKHVAKTWGGYDVNEMLEAFLHYTGLRQWSSSRGAIPKPPPALNSFELIAFVIGASETNIIKAGMISEGYKIIRDDLKPVIHDPGG